MTTASSDIYDVSFVEKERARINKELARIEKMHTAYVTKSTSFKGMIGLRVRQLRKEKNMKQHDFYEYGVDEKIISLIECGGEVGLIRLEKVIRALKVSPADFFSHDIFKTLL